MGDRLVLGGFEFATVTSLIALKENAYGAKVRMHLEALLGRPVAIGAVYTTLARLEDKGFVSSRMGDPRPERGGRAKRYYKVEALGHKAFAATMEEQDRLRQTLPAGALPA